MWPGYGNHMAWMWIWPLLGTILLVWFVWAITRASRLPSSPPPEESPEIILKRRYAGGEIDANEYERRLSDLRK